MAHIHGLKAGLLIAAAVVLASTGAWAGAAQPIAIRNVRILTVAGPPIDRGTIVVEGATIAAVGVTVPVPAGARIIDGTGLTACPGFFDAFNALGLIEITDVPAANDWEDTVDPITPQLRAVDAFNPASALLPVAAAAGVLISVAGPGPGNVVAGQSVLVRTLGAGLDDMVIQRTAALHVNLGEGPIQTYGSRGRAPMTRMGVAALFRDVLNQAQEYRRRIAAGTGTAANPRLDPLVAALEGTLPVVIRAHRRDDILTALRLADEFSLRLILLGATDAYRVADVLAKRGVPVILSAPDEQPSRIETLGATYDGPARLSRAGVRFAFHSNETTLVRQMIPNLGLFMAHGLPYDETLKALTVYPATIFGIDDRLGTIQPGKEATLFLSRGDPLQARSPVVTIFVRGEERAPRSYQTDLCERYIGSKNPAIPCLPK
jgi:imidazolonepropionase-like amidohydrolase